MGTAKLVFWLPRRTAVLMPTTLPLLRLISGPPELPGLIGASVCSISSMPANLEVMPEMMPRVPV